MRSNVFAAGVAATVLLSFSAIAEPCKCKAAVLPQMIRSTHVIFEGRVAQVTNPEREPSTVRYTFDVKKGWKGAREREQVTVVSDKTGSCAVKLSQGQSFVIGATDEGMGYPQLKPCHPFFKPSAAKEAAPLRKSLDDFLAARAQAMGAPDAHGHGDGHDHDHDHGTTLVTPTKVEPKKTAAKKKKKR